MKILSTIFLLVCVIGISCKQNTAKSPVGIIDVGSAMTAPTTIKCSDIGSRITYLPLETNDQSVIGAYPNIRLSEDRIFVSSNKQPLKVFNRNTGEYLHSIGQVGEAPEDYSDDGIGNLLFWIDDTARMVYFPGSGIRRLVYYDFQGRYQGEVKLPSAIQFNYPIALKYVIDNEKLFIHNTEAVAEDEPGIISLDVKTQKMIDSIPSISLIPPKSWTINSAEYRFGGFVTFGGHLSPTVYDKERAYFQVAGIPSIWKFQDNIRCKEDFKDTIYSIEQGSRVPLLFFNLGKWSWPFDERFQKNGCMERIHIDYVLEGSSCIYFHFHTGYYLKREERKAFCGIYSKETSITKVMARDKVDNDLLKLMPFSIYTADTKGRFGALLPATEIIDWLEKNPATGDKTQRAILERVKEEDNPVVVIIE